MTHDLLTPVAVAAPAGSTDLYQTQHAAFTALEGAYNYKKRDEAGEADRPGKSKPWSELRDMAAKLFSETKDFRVALWFAEASARARGYQGLSDGCEVLLGMLDQFWETGFPLLDSAGKALKIRRNAFNRYVKEIAFGNDRETIVSISDESGAIVNVCLLDFTDYERWTKIELHWQKWLKGQKAKLTETTEIQYSAIIICIEKFKELDSAVRIRFGEDENAPYFTNIVENLQKCVEKLDLVCNKRDGAADLGGLLSGNGSVKLSNGISNPVPVGGMAGTRAEAVQRLKDIADFFRLTEPASPVPYLIDRAVRWTQMRFDEIIKEMVSDKNAIEAIDKVLTPPKPDSNSEDANKS